MAQNTRLTRRLAGMLAARLDELGLERVADPRYGATAWPIQRLLVPVLVGIVVGSKGLAEVEKLTTDLSKPCARLLNIRKRVPDTTLRDTLVRLDIDALRGVLWHQNKLAFRRKAVEPVELPFGVITMDGRSTATRLVDELHAQTQHRKDGGQYALVRTITTTLVSARAKPCLDICPIPPTTNEVGHFGTAFEAVASTYGEELIQLVTYDAGGCSLENGRIVEEANRAYLFRLKANQPELYTEANRLLGHLGVDEAEAITTDGRGTSVVCRRLWRTTEMAGWNGWNHLRTVLRVESETTHQDGSRTVEQRYFISSLRSARLSVAQWLLVVRLHWGVENNNHWTWDAIFREDTRPWILEPLGMLAVMALRRIAYNMLTLYRSVTQRSDEKRSIPWKTLINEVYVAVLTATAAHTAGLRSRTSRALA